MRRVWVAAVLAGVLSCGGGCSENKTISPSVLEDVKASTVYVKMKINGVDTASGSGFVIRHEGNTTLIATNDHVVTVPEIYGNTPIPSEYEGEDRDQILEMRKLAAKAEPQFNVVFSSGTADELTFPAEVIARNPASDIAILRARGISHERKPIQFENPTDPRETLPVFMFGFPFGSRLAMGKTNPAMTVTNVAVSSIRRDEDGQSMLVQLSGNLNSGNSGGPIVDADGKLVAISVSTIPGTGIGFGIPAIWLVQTMNGGVGNPTLTAKKTDSTTAEITVRMLVVDPLNHLKRPLLAYQTGHAPSHLLEAKKTPVRLPNTKSVMLQRDGYYMVGTFQVKLSGDEPVQLTTQVSYVNKSGQTVLMRPETFEDDFAATDRKAFEYVSVDDKISGRIAATAQGWVERGESSREQPSRAFVQQFNEVARTDEYVELRNTAGLTLRLFAHRISSQAADGSWETSHHGSWTTVTAEDLEPVTQNIAGGSTERPVDTAPAPPSASTSQVIPDASRQVWKYADIIDKNKYGTYSRTDTGWYEEVEIHLGISRAFGQHTFREVSRNTDFIEIHDPERNTSARIYDDRAEFKLGDKWVKFAVGKWVPAEGAATVEPPPSPTKDKPAKAAGNDRRRVWNYVDPMRRKVGAFTNRGDDWVEAYDETNGTVTNKLKWVFREVSRTADCIELIDARGIGVRIYQDHAESRIANAPWSKLCEGKWSE